MPPTASTRAPQQRSLATRQRLVAAACAAFARRGFDGASTREIAQRAGVALAALPYHFKTKDALWRAAADDLFARLRARFPPGDDDLATTDLAGRLRRLLGEFVRFCAEHPELHHFMMREGSAPSARLTWLVDAHIRPMFAAVDPLLERAAAAGLLRPQPTPHLLYMIMGAASVPYAAAPAFRLVTGKDPGYPRLVAAHVDAVVDLFLPSTRGVS